MLRACAADVQFYGDDEQIPWLPFMASFDAMHTKFDGEVMVEKRSMTHRFGAKTCAMWLDVYGKIYPCTCHDHSDDEPEVVRISSAVQVPALPSGKILTFTQEEKITVQRELNFSESIKKLKSMDAGGLSTVAEDQGGTHDCVSVVRVVNRRDPKESRKSPSIYNRQPWVLVGTTRHKGQLRYYTAAEDDMVVARIELSRCAVRLDAVLARKSWEEVRLGARHVRLFGVGE